MSDCGYLPALRFPALTRFFDRFVRIGMFEQRFKAALVEAAGPGPGDRLLDLGCGTGTLALMVKRAEPGARVTGLDADPEILEIARAKAEDEGEDVELVEALSTEMPFEDRSFDRILSTLFFHHLSGADKRRTAAEIVRVLKPRGELHVVDLGHPPDPLMRAAVTTVRVFDGFERTRDNVAGALPAIFEDAGLEGATETRRFRTPIGGLSLYRARRR